MDLNNDRISISDAESSLSVGIGDGNDIDILTECLPIVTYNDQSNKTRYAYTLSEYEPDGVHCHLTNGLYLSRASRSDEKVILTESMMVSMTRTILFMYITQKLPEESMYDIIYSGHVTHNLLSDNKIIENLTLFELIRELDHLFGERFSKVCRRPITLVYYEYISKLRYYNYGESIASPSARDYVDLYRFIKTPISTLTPITEFILSRNNFDYKSPLQQRVKFCY